MPDLLDELRRYADAAEAAVPSRDLPGPERRRRFRGRVVAVGAAIAAAVAVFAVWVSPVGDEASTVDTADESTVDAGPWDLERVGVLDETNVGGAPVWFADQWWAMAPADGELMTSTDGARWDTVDMPLDSGDVLANGGLVANENRLAVVGVDGSDQVVAATTDDGSTWTSTVVGASGVPRRDLANVVAVAFDDRLGVAVRVPTDLALQRMLADRRLTDLVEELVGSESGFSYHVDTETRTLHVDDGEGEEIFSGSPLELGLTEQELDRVIANRAGSGNTDTHDWRLHLSDNGTTWDAVDLPQAAREAVTLRAIGPALTARGTDDEHLTTTNGRSWTTPDLTATSAEHEPATGVALLATSGGEFWLLRDSEPAFRADALDEPFRSTSVTGATAVARSGATSALLVDATPDDPSEQEDLEAQWGWALAEFTWTDGTFEFTGSYMNGGTFTDHRNDRSWEITYDDFAGVGAGNKIENDNDERHFLDPDTGSVLVTIGDEFKDAIAEQHPQWADAVHGETVPDPTPAPAQRLRVALLDGDAEPTYVDLPPLPNEVWGASLTPGPDGTFLVIAATRTEGDANQFSIAERTAFIIRPE